MDTLKKLTTAALLGALALAGAASALDLSKAPTIAASRPAATAGSPIETVIVAATRLPVETIVVVSTRLPQIDPTELVRGTRTAQVRL